jgi:hypothetical protein
MKSSGTYLGVNWERHQYGLYLYSQDGGYLVSRKYVGNGSDKLGVRESVQTFRKDALGIQD